MPGPGDINGSTSAEVLEEALSGHLARLAGAKTPLLPTLNTPNTTVWSTYIRPAQTNQRPYKA